MDEYRDLAQMVINFLTPAFPYLLLLGNEAAEEASKKIGGDLWEGAKSLWHKLWPKVEAKPDAVEIVKELAESPKAEDSQAALRRHLTKIFTDDNALANEVRQILDKTGNTRVQTKVQGDRNVTIGGNVSGGIISTGDHFNSKDK